MKMKYKGTKPEIEDGGFYFRRDATFPDEEGVTYNMDFCPEIPNGYELIAASSETVTGWVLHSFSQGSTYLEARYEPTKDEIDPRDEQPSYIHLRLCLVKTIKQEYVEESE